MPITSFPPAPSRADPATFADRADAYLGHLENPFVAEANALEDNVNAKEASATLSAANALASANAASNTANVTAWVSGTTYAVGANVWDPVNFMTYRNMTVGGSLTTRPGEDFAKAKWQLVSGQGDVTMAGTQTITGLKSFTVSPWVPTAPTITSDLTAASTAYVANRVQEYAVTLTGDQTVGGTKTFTNLIYGNIRGTATCGVDALSGYVSGAGATVSQSTSKSTAVTINKPSGIIVTHNQALAAGASVVFTVNNSLVSGVDFSTVVAHPKSGTNYTVSVLNATSGAFTLRLTNITGGSLSESVSIGYSVFSASSFS